MKTENSRQVLNKTEAVVNNSSEPNPVVQPKMWVDWYNIVYGGNEQEAKKDLALLQITFYGYTMVGKSKP